MAELITNRWLARDPSGLTIQAGWDDIQRTARTVSEACGQQSLLHYHAYGDACNERCDIYPPAPEPVVHQPQVVAAAVPTMSAVCVHGVGLDRDCGECITDAKMRRLNDST